MRDMALLLFLIVAASTWVGCQRPSTTTSTEAAPAAQPAVTAAPAAASAAPADPLAFDPEKAERNDYGEPIRKGADFPVPAPFRRDTRTFTIALSGESGKRVKRTE